MTIRLERYHPNPWSLTPYQVIFRTEMLNEERVDRYRDMAGAAQTTMLDQKGLKAWFEDNQDE